MQLLNVLDDWTKLIDAGVSIDVIYTDFQKAFDKLTVPHRRLLAKLESYGFHSNVLNWIKSFLEDRRQRVVIACQESRWSDVGSGVPQGSVLGPILFLIFINDIVDLGCTAYLFVDDMKFYTGIFSERDTARLQSDIYTVAEWTNNLSG